MNEISWDVAVIGGGSAGLSAALMLGRARRRVVVLDAGTPRNRFAAHMHGVLGHDGRPPADLLSIGRREVESYGGTILTTTATLTRRDGDGFAVETADGAIVRARTLLVTTGARDELPELDGLAERWGRGVAVCPYCDGYEVRDRRIGILATGPASEFQAQLLRQWSPSITYLADAVGAPGGETRSAFDARGIRVEEGPVRRVVSRDDRVAGVEMADGRLIELDAIFTIPRLVPRDEPLRQLGAERTEHPWGSFVTVDENGRTSIDGVWAAGNVVNAMANVSISIGAGALVAGAINHALILDDVRLAVSAATPAPARHE
ncbi:NAD(P)/FAD-dependent oxidoreductase [Micromonospora sp. 15K316]|uniref:NAD(P)/FAD-dependent oxidoreductase n=1 Tax=Micromonospora sp. 15K316 TaxID=2530376 RepID=UPI001048815B|nr:NAD(P)/FAD-dependent oxidoreductase [Micromonospora sp. 15K316]TDC40619.1 NAD(P)/FAD-dependent oxidoreductase [Micromonospora sp. 15K316]